ncbi:hypothetical protein BVRB_3g057640 [Beta vulgaris subsp. vulgaris]|nr:hypothetical protein BVRB_3g057640 [Beta vulgaris subsp. vulgaris]
MHFRVQAKALRLSGGDHIHYGTVVGKLETKRAITLGFVDLLCDDYTTKDRSRAIYLTQSWICTAGVLPVAPGGAVVNRVALETCVQARNEGHDLITEVNAIFREASKWSPERAAACEVWKKIKFEFPTTDTL